MGTSSRPAGEVRLLVSLKPADPGNLQRPLASRQESPSRAFLFWDDPHLGNLAVV